MVSASQSFLSLLNNMRERGFRNGRCFRNKRGSMSSVTSFLPEMFVSSGSRLYKGERQPQLYVVELHLPVPVRRIQHIFSESPYQRHGKYKCASFFKKSISRKIERVSLDAGRFDCRLKLYCVDGQIKTNLYGADNLKYHSYDHCQNSDKAKQSPSCRKVLIV